MDYASSCNEVRFFDQGYEVGKGFTIWSYTCMLSSTSVLNSPLFSPSPAPSIFSPWPFGEELNWWWFLFSLVDLFEKSAGILCKELIEHASF